MTNKQLAILAIIAFAIALLGALAVAFYPSVGHHWGKAILAFPLLIAFGCGLLRTN